MVKGCPTCAALQAVLTAARVPAPAARAIARSEPVRKADRAVRGAVSVGRLKKKASDYNKRLSRHLIEERKKQTKKNGQFKKGKSMKTVMAAAHKCVKREMR